MNSSSDKQSHEQNEFSNVLGNKNLLQSLFDSSNASISLYKAIRDTGGKIVDFEWLFANKKAQQFSGNTTLVGKTYLELFPMARKIEAFERFIKVVDEGNLQDFEVHHQLQDGNSRWYRVIANKFGDGLISSTEDITDYKQKDLLLKDKNTLLQSVVENLLAGVILLKSIRNNEGRIIDFIYQMVSPKAAEIMERDDLVGKKIAEVFPEIKPSGFFDKYVDVVETGKPWNADTFYPFEGYNKWVYVTFNKMDDGLVLCFLDITEKKNAEEQLLKLKDALAQKAANKYLALFNSIDEGFAVIEMIYDESGKAINYRFEEVNPAFETMTGFKNVIGKTALDLIPETEAFWWVEKYDKVTKTGEPSRFENKLDSIDMWFSVFVSRIDNGENKLAIVFDNISERKKAEEELRKSEEHKAYLLKLSDAIRPLADPFEIQGGAAIVMGQHLNVNRSFYAEMHTIKGEDYFIVERDYYSHGTSSLVGKFKLEDYGPALMKELKLGNPLIIENTTDDKVLNQQEKEAYLALNIKAYVAVPLLKNGIMVAVMGVHNSEPREWTQKEVKIIEETAERTWAAVEQARAENALRKAEEKYLSELENKVVQRTLELNDQTHFIKNITNTIPDIISVFEFPSRKLLFCNRDAIVSLGFDKEDIKTMTPEDRKNLIHPDDRLLYEQYQKKYETLKDDEENSTEFRIKNKKGEWVWQRVRGRVIKRNEDGTPLQTLDIGQNITVQKKAQQQLIHEIDERIKREARLKDFEEIVKASHDAIVSADKEGKITHWNPASELLYGYKKKEVLGKSLKDIIIPEWKQDELSRLLKLVYENGESIVDLETERVGRNGKIIEILLTISPLKDEHGNIIGSCGVTKDVSERKRVENELMLLKLSQQKEILNAVLNAIEEERKAISESLHNGVGQLLYATKIRLESLMVDPESETEKNKKTQIDKLLEDAIEQTRNISHQMSPQLLETYGLKDAVESVVKNFRTENLYFNFKFACKPERFERDIEIAVFRIVQELVNNIVKHSKASIATIKIECDKNNLFIIAKDNGVGFKKESSKKKKSGIGMQMIENRVTLMNGTLKIESDENSGTKVAISLPI